MPFNQLVVLLNSRLRSFRLSSIMYLRDHVGYPKNIKATRKRQLNFLAKQAQELNLGYSTIDASENCG
jgi:hypothetical protein